MREREGGSSTILNVYLGFAEISLSCIFLFMRTEFPPKKIRKYAKRILRNTFPQTPSISQNFARVPHFCTPPSLPPKHCGGVQSVLPHFCFSRSTTLRVVALQRAGNASLSFFLGNKFEQMI